MRRGRLGWLLVVVVALLGAGCAGRGEMAKGDMAKSEMAKDATTMATPSLYQRLGGKPAITAVVDDFVANVAADNRINGQFANTNIPRLKNMLVDQICEATGGPCKYTGRDMKSTHRGMKITDAEFNALVEDLVKSLDKFKVPAKEKGELLAALGSMKPDIVGQ